MITILCSGSRGDIQPYIALAQQIKKLGKQVRIASGKSFSSVVASYGIDFYALGADLTSIEIDPKLLKAAQTSDNPLKMLLTFNKMKRYAKYMTEDMYQACIGSELILYHPGCAIGYFAAMEMGVPCVLASPFPLHKTKKFSSVLAYGRYRAPVKLTYAMLQKMLWMASKTGIESLWREHFHKLPQHFGMPFERISAQHIAVISCSDYIFPRPQDWNPNIHQLGYWFAEEKFSPDRDLAAFLDAGDRPIYFGFGSVFCEEDKENVIDKLAKSLQKTGKRGILSGMGKIAHLPKNLFAVGHVPHTWLFPHCSAVCHHGGAGTSAAGFWAGTPSIIIPHSNDQFAWAHRAYDLGIGARPFSKRQLTVDALCDAISFTMDKEVVNKAAEMGAKIANEHGAADCAKRIVEMIE